MLNHFQLNKKTYKLNIFEPTVVVSTNQWLKLSNSTFPCMYIPFPPTDPGIKFPNFDNFFIIWQSKF